MRLPLLVALVALSACVKPIDQDGDGHSNDVDCNDLDPAVNPDAVEICNGIDDDCSFAVDDAATDAPAWFTDADADGYGGGEPTTACAPPVGAVANGLDCDDTSARFNPAAAESDCTDPNDYNCDGSAGAVDADGDGFWACEECDDATKANNPDAKETCDGDDNDCDGLTDEDAVDAPVWYLDLDSDSYGVTAATVEACEAPAGYAARGGDCNDVDADFHPSAPEGDCSDPEDYNCDGSVGYADRDGDGWAACDDCDDDDARSSPVGVELCDEADNDCDGEIDNDALDAGTWRRDADKDTYGDAATTTDACDAPSGYVADDDDCDDTDKTVYPGATETCDDEDDDCDGTVDEDASDAKTWYADLDGDGAYGKVVSVADCDGPTGYGTTATDCDDLDDASYPGAAEVCDEADNDCDGTADDSPVDIGTWYADADGDKFGSASSKKTACEAPSGYVADGTDCDDASSYVHPGALEFCDAKDNDCDGTADEADAYDASDWWVDGDGDGYGKAGATATRACSAPSGYVDDDDDCDDAKKAVSPAATEFCNGVDDNCDGVTDGTDAADADLYYADVDGDSYGDPDSPATLCAVTKGYVSDATDCEDGDATAYPESREEEVPKDGVDQDCDGEDACDDMDCDGLPDLMFFSWHDGDYYTTNYGYFTNGDTSYAATDRWSFVNYATWFGAVEDVDDDGYKDVVLPSYCGNAACSGSTSTKSEIYWGSASGYSTSDRTQLSTIGAYDACVADLDGDGYNEVVYANYYSGSSYSVNSQIFWGSATGWSDSDKTDLPAYGSLSCEVEDFDADGDLDVFLMSHYDGDYSTSSRVFWNTAGAFSSTDYDELPAYHPSDVDVADYDDDGYLDIAFADHYDGDYYVYGYVYYGSSSGYSTTSRDSLLYYGMQEVESADLNGDGYRDLVFASYYDTDYYTNSYVYWGSATGFSDSNRDAIPLYGAMDVDIVDLDNDGWLDLVFGQYYDGNHYVSQYVYFGSKTGFSSSDTWSIDMWSVYDVNVADLDHNGYNDIVYGVYYDGDHTTTSYVVWGSAKGWSSSSVSTFDTYGSGSSLVVGD